MIPWTETDEPATTPPPAMQNPYPFAEGSLVMVPGEDFACEVSAIYAGYASLLTVDGDLINRPLCDLAPFCGQVSEEEAQEVWLMRAARLQALQQAGCPLVVTEPCDSQEDDCEGLAGFVAGYVFAALIWLSPLALLLWIGVEAGRHWTK